MRGKMLAVIGGQYGSEGKGVIVNHIADQYGLYIRVGSPNAGHTFYWRGEKHVMQSIPCGWTNPNAVIMIGRGSLINMDLLMREIRHIEGYYPNFRKRLIIDAKAGILDERFHNEEGGVNGEMHKRIGSTGEGVGPARVARINRNPLEFRFFDDVAFGYGLKECMYENTPRLIAEMQDSGVNILLEGTQGSGLSLIHGPWPYVTSIDTNAAQILAECGIAPRRLTNTILVTRTFPIRVAGNSGPMNEEISWYDMSSRFGREIQEKTTVTKKVRRISKWDSELFRQSVLLNSPSSIALTFADYVDPSIEGKTDATALTPKVREFIAMVEKCGGASVSMVGTGGPECSVIDIGEV